MADPWYGPVGKLGVETSDGRIIERDGFHTRSLPLPLDWQEYTDEGHDKAVTVGTITALEVLGDGTIWATGEWLDQDVIPKVAPARALVTAGVVYPSVEAAGCAVEYRELGGGAGAYVDGEYEEDEPWRDVCVFTGFEMAKVTLVSVQALPDLRIVDGEPPTMAEVGMGSLTAAVRTSGWDGLPVAATDTEWDGSAAEQRVADWAGIDAEDAGQEAWDRYARAFLWQDPDADPMTRGAYKLGVADVVDGELTLIPRGVYAVAGVLSGARGGADIPEADQERLRTTVRGLYEKIATAAGDDSIEAPFALVACAADRPPAAWFDNPRFAGPTPIEITADGRIFGHIGLHGVPHRGLPGRVGIPRSMSAYREFRLGQTITADGTGVPTGKVTLGGGHADPELGMVAALRHYDDVSTTVANVVAGDDEFGVWIAGAIKAGTPESMIDEIRQSPPSGDWRTDVLGNLELITVHSVNTPGFPVYRVGVDDKAGYSLVASSALVTSRSQPQRSAPAADERYVRSLAAALRTELAAGALSIPTEFDVDAPDLRAEFARHGVPWPTISAVMGGRPTGQFEVSEACVLGMLRRVTGPLAVELEPDPAEMRAELAFRSAQAKLAALRLREV